MTYRIVVVCIGNQLVADDGFGWAVYQNLQQQSLPVGIRVVFLGLGGIDLLEVLESEEMLIVVDGVQLGGQPGQIHQLGWAQLPAQKSRPISGHGIGIREALDVGKRLFPEKMPQEVILIGAEGKCFDQLGAGLSDEVLQAVPQVVAIVKDLVGSRLSLPSKSAV